MKNNNLQKRKKLRWQQWDYNEKGIYFITICTKNKENLFGRITIKDNKNIVELSEIGKVVDKYINNINDIYLYIEVNNYVIMPNHIHLIIFINNNIENNESFSKNN